ncbi:hypothetical protein KDK77_04705 [bacterium]|nr:hypothetical protein [bacterium]
MGQRIITSEREASELAAKIVAQREQAPISHLDLLSGLTLTQIDQLRQAGFGGAEELSPFYNQTTAQMIDFAIEIAQSNESPELTGLLFAKLDSIIQSPAFNKQSTEQAEQTLKLINDSLSQVIDKQDKADFQNLAKVMALKIDFVKKQSLVNQDAIQQAQQKVTSAKEALSKANEAFKQAQADNIKFANNPALLKQEIDDAKAALSQAQENAQKLQESLFKAFQDPVAFQKIQKDMKQAQEAIQQAQQKLAQLEQSPDVWVKNAEEKHKQAQDALVAAQNELKKSEEESQIAIDEFVEAALNIVKDKNTSLPSYQNSLLFAMEVFNAVNDTKNYENAMEKFAALYPKEAEQLELKKLQDAFAGKAVVEEMKKMIPSAQFSEAELQKSLSALALLQKNIKSGDLELNPEATQNLFEELFVWLDVSQSADAPSIFKQEVLSTLKALNGFVGQEITDLLANPKTYQLAQQWLQIQSQALSGFEGMQALVDSFPFDAILSPDEAGLWVDIKTGGIKTQNPTIAVLQDNIMLDTLDGTGGLAVFVSDYKNKKLIEFLELVEPSASVKKVGNQMVIVGLTELQVQFFANILTLGFTAGYAQTATTFIEYISALISPDKTDEQNIEAIQSALGLSYTNAQKIYSAKGNSEQQTTLLNELLKFDAIESLEDKLKNAFNQPLSETVNAYFSNTIIQLEKDTAPQEQIDAVKNIQNALAASNLFTQQYRLISGTAYIMPPLVSALNAVKSGNIEALKNAFAALTLHLPGAEKRSLQTEFSAVLQTIQTALDTDEAVAEFLAFIQTKTTIVNQMYSQAYRAFKESEREALPLVAENPQLGIQALPSSTFGQWFDFWTSVKDERLDQQSRRLYTTIQDAQSIFAYLEKVSAGASPQETADVRRRVEKFAEQQLDGQISSIIPVILTQIERNKGDVDAVIKQMSPQIEQLIGKNAVISLKKFFLPHVSVEEIMEAPITLASVYQGVNGRISELYSLYVDSAIAESTSDVDRKLNQRELTIIRTQFGIDNPYSLSVEQQKAIKIVAKQYSDYIDEVQTATGFTQDITQAIFALKGAVLENISLARLGIIQQAIDNQGLNMKIDEGVLIILPTVALTDEVKQRFESDGLNADILLDLSDGTDSLLKELRQLFPTPEQIKPKTEVPAAQQTVQVVNENDYFKMLYSAITSTVGYDAFSRRNQHAAEMVEEYFASLEQNRPFNPRMVDTVGFKFLTNTVIRNTMLKEMIGNPQLLENPSIMRAFRQMLSRLDDVGKIIVDGSFLVENQEVVKAHRSELIDGLDQLRDIMRTIGVGAMFQQIPTIETLTVLDSKLQELNATLNSIVTGNVQVVVAPEQIAPEQESPKSIDFLVQGLSKDEVDLIQLVLGQVFDISLTKEDMSDDEFKVHAGDLFFRILEQNKARIEILIGMLDEIGDVQSDDKNSARYASAVIALKSKILNSPFMQKSSSAVSSIVQRKVSVSISQPILSQISTISPNAELNQKIRNILVQIDNAVGVNLMQEGIQADPLTLRLLDQLSLLSGGSINVRQMLYDDKLASIISLLLDDALETELLKEAFPSTARAFTGLNFEQSRKNIVQIIANHYLGTALPEGLNPDVISSVKTEIIPFIERKTPQLVQITTIEDLIERKRVFAGVLRSLFGENLFDSRALEDEERQAVRNLIFDDIARQINQQESENRHVFVLSFDALAQEGKITANESNFILKETIELLTQASRNNGKDVRFVIVSSKYNSTDILEQLRSLRVSELQVDVFARDLGNGNKSLNELIEAVKQNYAVSYENLKMVVSPQDQTALTIAGNKNIQAMVVDTDITVERTTLGVEAATLVGALNLFVNGTVFGFQDNAASIRIQSYPLQTPNAKLSKIQAQQLIDLFINLLKQQKVPFDEQQFITVLTSYYGTANVEQLKQNFYNLLTYSVIGELGLNLAELSVQDFKQEIADGINAKVFEGFDISAIGAEMLNHVVLGLVLQPPKQKISNAYLREYEKMKLAEEFA